ncbi:MAG: T9SS C-terminal target domain-containing protein [candidate division Zixibacteria bacterium]|nr:T9SS C-terminal target domain-containing protein [candidate division Zixibacteria bacterium]
MLKKTLMTLVIALLPIIASAQVTDDGKPVKVITDGDIGALNFWSADTVYNLQGFCYVEDGEVLIIDPGTVIKGNEGSGAGATALVVARGGKIYAEGTATQPVVFTSIIDDVDDPFDIPLTDARGKWGGLIILGKAGINTTAGVGQIEGIPETEPRGQYGGTDDEDNSGVLRYVSVRHGGSEIGLANEINGVTFGAVGRGTVVDHIEVFYNLDDGFEWFGGTVNCYNLVAAFVGDDAFDYDEGWRGAGQFWFSLHASDAGDHGGEHDGGTSPVDGQPFATPLISNATYVGRGADQTGSQRCMIIRDNAGGAYYNSIFTDHGTYGISVENNDTEPTDSRDRLLQGQIKFLNNVWWGFGNGNTAASITGGDTLLENRLFNNGNDMIGNPSLQISRTPNGGLDPRPTDLATPGWSSWIDPKDATNGFNPPAVAGYPSAIDVNWPDFEVADYPGAFDPNGQLWICNWTALDNYGYLDEDCGMADCFCTTDDGKPVIEIFDADITDTTVFSRDTVYNLKEFVYVENGEVLIIEPGTIIKGDEGTGANAKALIVAQGGKIYALGAKDCPVVLTSIIDDVDDPFDIPLSDARGKWGGLLILGQATINTTAGVGQIEGIPETEPRGQYGGTNDEDNSGVLKYVSVRHGGSEIGLANEINGVTFGAVGNGTVVNHVEVFYNLDDGFEWFGGTVNCYHLVAGFVGDDAFDYDEGWRGAGQFWFNIHATDAGDHSGEHDGGTSPVDGTPYASPLISNVTYLGRGADQTGSQRCMILRDNAAGSYFNSIFDDHGTYGISIENNDTEPTDSRDRLLAGDILFKNNIWFGFGNGNTAANITNGDTLVENRLFTNGNDLAADPTLSSISRVPNDSLDPRPTDLTGAGWSAWIDPKDPTHGYNPSGSEFDVDWPEFTPVAYAGAFDPSVNIEDSWVANWTAMYCYGFFGTVEGGNPTCCIGTVGNVQLEPNCNPSDQGVDVGDLTNLIDHLFINFTPICCVEEADIAPAISGGAPDGSIDVGDLTAMIDHLFINFPVLPGCQ